MELFRRENIIIALIFIALVAIGVSFTFHNKIDFPGQAPRSDVLAEGAFAQKGPIVPLPPPPPQKLSNPPAIIKAVYVTGYSAGSKKYSDYLSSLLKNTEINAVVIDVKDYSGLISYDSSDQDVKKYSLYNNAIKDIDALVRSLHDKNIYVIGRIAVFEDPGYSKARPELAIYNKSATTDLTKPVLWKDNNGLSWLDPASKDVWDYDISLAKDIFSHGFDEVNFDYVRFPSDGKTENMGFPVYDGKTAKADIIKNFFTYTRQQLTGEKISVDLFGQVTTNTDDMGIGQLLENAFENFDYVSPMVYPSHYADNFLGYKNPADHPYEIIKYAMDTALTREDAFSKQQDDLALATGNNGAPAATAGAVAVAQVSVADPVPSIPMAKFRPWLQDFNMGADYTADMVKSEIKATQDALGDSFEGFMLWNPSNIYTQDAIKPDIAANPDVATNSGELTPKQ